MGEILGKLFGQQAQSSYQMQGMGAPGAIPETGAAQPSYFNALMSQITPGLNSEAQTDNAVSDEGLVTTAPKRRKFNWLAMLGDAILLQNGMKPMFAENMKARDMREAMEGFTSDPDGAIQRMSRIPGMENKAWELFMRSRDDKRADGTLEHQKRALDIRNDDYVYNMTAGMMGAANEKSWPKLRELAIKRAADRGVDVTHLIPEAYDQESVDFIRYGAIKPKDQMVEEGRNTRHTVTEAGKDERHDESLEQRDEEEGGRNTRAANAEAGRNTRAANAEAGKDRRAKPRARSVNTKYGPGEVSPDGRWMKVDRGGKTFVYRNVNGTWVPKDRVGK